jgi:flagellum-specific ATP synthase
MGHYPAIDILNSVSRLSSQVSSPEQRDAGRRLREALSTYRQSEDLIQLGAYVSGSNPRLDAAIRARPQVLEFLQQDISGKSPLEETVSRMQGLARLLS